MQLLKKIFSLILRISISAILLIFLFRYVDKKDLYATIRHADKLNLFWAFCSFFLVYVLCILRWEVLLKAAQIRLPLKRIIISFSGGIFFSLFLPSTIGGDLVRSIDLSAHTKRPREVVATVILDRLSGYVGLAILALLALSFGWELVQDKIILWSVGAIIFLLVVILLVLFNEYFYCKVNQLLQSRNAGRIRVAIRNLHREIHIFRRHKSVILYNLIMSLIIQALSPISFYFIALSLGLKLKMIYFFVFLPIIGAFTLLPISIGGLGLRDVSTIYFFGKAGVSKDLAFAMSLINFFLILLCGIIGGIIYVLTVRHRRIQYHKPPPLQAKA